MLAMGVSNVVKINAEVNKNGYLYRRCRMLQVPLYVRKFTLLHVLVWVEQDKSQKVIFFFFGAKAKRSFCEVFRVLTC